jgi:multidrug transporter EmrE-like cation transporter
MGYLFLILALVLNATANLLMKVGADRLATSGEGGMLRGLLTNYHLLAGLSLFALNVVFYVAALTRLNLSIAYPIMMAGGVLIAVSVSLVYLDEVLSWSQGIGMLLLVAGIALVACKAAP